MKHFDTLQSSSFRTASIFFMSHFTSFFWSVKSIDNGNFSARIHLHDLISFQRLRLRLMYWGLSKTLKKHCLINWLMLVCSMKMKNHLWPLSKNDWKSSKLIIKDKKVDQKLFQVEVFFNFVRYLFGFEVHIFFKQAVNIYSMELNCFALFIVSINVLVSLVSPLKTLIWIFLLPLLKLGRKLKTF